MRLLKIFALLWEDVLEQRSRILVYFSTTLINVGIVMLFWMGAHKSNAGNITAETYTAINTYYLLYLILGGVLISHSEEHIAVLDIKEGGLVNFLLKPISYIGITFMSEVTYRLMQGSFGFIIFWIVYLAFPQMFKIDIQLSTLYLVIPIIILALVLSYLFKVCIALLAFWIVDIRGIFEVLDMAFIVFTGNLIPLFMLSATLRAVMESLPFAYMMYFPIRALQGALSMTELWQTLGIQVAWISLFYILHKILWSAGIKKYSGVGQ
jgi:ABC-2 type transport system permease protein